MDMPMGTLVTKDQVKLVAWPASSPVSKGFTTIESVVNRGLIDSVAANEPLTETKLASIEAGAGLPPSITAGHAGGLGEGERGRRRRRLRRPRHPRRRDGDAEALRVEGQHDPRRGERRRGAHGRHPLRPGEGARRPADPDLGGHAAGHAVRRRADRARRQRRRSDAHAPQPDGPEADRDHRHPHRRAARTGSGPAPVVARPAAPRPSSRRPPAPAPVAVSKIYSVEAIRAAKRSEEVIR